MMYKKVFFRVLLLACRTEKQQHEQMEFKWQLLKSGMNVRQVAADNCVSNAIA